MLSRRFSTWGLPWGVVGFDQISERIGFCQIASQLRGGPPRFEKSGVVAWNIVYYETLLGRIDEKTGRITGVEV